MAKRVCPECRGNLDSFKPIGDCETHDAYWDFRSGLVAEDDPVMGESA